MMLNMFSKLLMFYFAYLPLFVIILLQNVDITRFLFIIIVIMVLVGFLLMYGLLKVIKSIAPKRETFKLIADKNTDILSFIVTYIVPFAAHFMSINDWFSFGILFFIIAYLYLDTSLFCINPLLKILFRYNIYLVEQSDRSYYLLSKNVFFENGEYILEVVPLTDNLIIEVGEVNDD